MRILAALVLSASVLIPFHTAGAIEDRGSALVEVLGGAGCRLDPQDDRVIRASCPVEEAVGALAKLKAEGVSKLTPASQANFEQQPTIVAVRLTEFLAAHEIYRRFRADPSLTSLSVRVSVAQDDNFGHPREHLAESFDLDRRTFDRVDWARFNPYNFGRIGRHPVQTEWYREIALREIRNTRR